MNKTYSGDLSAKGMRFALVVARFNDFITSKLLDGALDTLKRHGAVEEDIEIAWVPGAFEIPLVTQQLARSKKYDGIVCLGAVIKGSTPHYIYVSNEVTKGIAQISLQYDLPIGFGVLTTDTVEQAVERAGSKAGNKGTAAALSTIEMVGLLRSFT